MYCYLKVNQVKEQRLLVEGLCTQEEHVCWWPFSADFVRSQEVAISHTNVPQSVQSTFSHVVYMDAISRFCRTCNFLHPSQTE